MFFDTNDQNSSQHQLLRETNEMLQSLPEQDEQCWNILNTLNRCLLEAKVAYLTHQSQKEIDELLLKVEMSRLRYSVNYFRQRYRSVIDLVQEDNDEVATMTKGSYYIRSETKNIKDNYLTTLEHKADIDRNDIH